MVFLSGPRQVGKTTCGKALGDFYLDWDAGSHQRLILHGTERVAEEAGLHVLGHKPVTVVFDELHKNPNWRQFLKGFFDVYEDRCRVIVTGSSKLDTYRRGGDSLMGRYFPYRMHPFSTRELLSTDLPGDGVTRPPMEIGDEAWEALWEHGGFPEPLAKGSVRFTKRWQDMRFDQLYKEDVRDMTRIQEVPLVGMLGRLLQERSAEQLVVANLARDVGVAPNTMKSWLEALCALHAGFLIRPWSKNVGKSLRKEPKWFLRDWSGIQDPGQRAETFVACHLLKAVEGWEDMGLGKFRLHYLRDTMKREVDFLVSKDGDPWFLVDAKSGSQKLSPALSHFQQQTGAPHAFQVSMDLDYVEADCFSLTTPVIVPAKTLLSQLL